MASASCVTNLVCADEQHTPVAAVPHPSMTGCEVAGKRRILLRKWFLSEPSQWWNHNFDKKTAKSSCFRYKKIHNALWIKGQSTPQWVVSDPSSGVPDSKQQSPHPWNMEIATRVKDGRCMSAIQLFHQMQSKGMRVDGLTFVRVLKACTNLALVEEGRHIHAQAVTHGFKSDIFVGSSLIDMYSKCRRIEDAVSVFAGIMRHDVVCWNTIILGYVKCGQPEKAIDLFRQMQYEVVKPNNFTFVGVLNACACLEALEEGKQVHAKVIQGGLESEFYVGSSLVDMYSKCGHMDYASRVFHSISERNVVCWNAMIVGYVKCNEGEKALELFEQMQIEGVEPDNVTFMGVLNASASISALEEGRHVHALIAQSQYNSDMFLGSSLVDMYVKCGSIHDAIAVFRKMPVRDVIAWNGMLMGYATHGFGRKALHLFQQMQCESVGMNGTTLICLLSACSHAGLESEGYHHFESMIPLYEMTLEMKHYNCMVDLLGRTGHLSEAEEIISTMPFPPHASVFLTLLSSCRTHGNVEMAQCLSEKILALDPDNASGYVLLSNIFAEAGDWGH